MSFYAAAHRARQVDRELEKSRTKCLTTPMREEYKERQSNHHHHRGVGCRPVSALKVLVRPGVMPKRPPSKIKQPFADPKSQPIPSSAEEVHYRITTDSAKP